MENMKVRHSGSMVLQTQDLRVGQANEPCIRLTQEKSMEFLV